MRGIGFTILGTAGGFVMNLLSWLIPNPPEWLRIVAWGLLSVFAVVLVIGLVMIVSSYRKARTEIQRKDSIILEQRDRLSELRKRLSEPAMLAIIPIISSMNDLNRDVSYSLAGKGVTEEQVDCMASRMGSNILTVLGWLTSRNNMSKLLRTLITLSAEMNAMNVGLRSEKLSEYEELKASLDEKKKVVGNPLLRRRIREYLEWSDGLYSFKLFLEYRFSLYKLPRWFPSRLRVSDEKISLAIDAQMDDAEGQVVKTIEESLIGRSDSGTGNV